jgi:2-phospho-L-lactate guanylyltransferase
VPTTVALVPLRDPGTGKSRLAAALSPTERAALATAMVEDVLTAARAGGVDRLVVLAAGDGAERVARHLGVEVARDRPGVDLNAAVGAATAALPADADVLVLAADLPALVHTEVAGLLATPADVVVAPTSGGGTGALLRRSGFRHPTAYGPGSAAAHERLARQAGAGVVVLETPGTALDVDTVTDLLALHDVAVGARTAALVPSLVRALR